MEIEKRFGLAVKKRRNDLNLSQEELGLRIGADQAYISRIEAGQINITLETANDIATALVTPIIDLLQVDKG